MEVFRELSNYTVYHFRYEENLMKESKYDAINSHLQSEEHEAFIKKVSELDDNQLQDNQKMITTDVVMFVIKWIEDHILYTDKNLGLFLKDLKVTK